MQVFGFWSGGQVGAWESRAAREQSRFESRWRYLRECCFSRLDLGLDGVQGKQQQRTSTHVGWQDGSGGEWGPRERELDCSGPCQSGLVWLVWLQIMTPR